MLSKSPCNLSRASLPSPCPFAFLLQIVDVQQIRKAAPTLAITFWEGFTGGSIQAAVGVLSVCRTVRVFVSIQRAASISLGSALLNGAGFKLMYYGKVEMAGKPAAISCMLFRRTCAGPISHFEGLLNSPPSPQSVHLVVYATLLPLDGALLTPAHSIVSMQVPTILSRHTCGCARKERREG